MSTKMVEVVPVVLEKHPDPETTALSIVKVGGYTVVARTEDWASVDRAAYVPIDGVLPERPEYAFLGKHRRIKAKKLRGVFSEGLLVPAPADAQLGDDVTAALGVTFFDPDVMDKDGNAGRVTAAPSVPEPPGPPAPRYTDIENIKGKHAPRFEEGEEVVAVEKIHGCNLRATWRLDAIEDVAVEDGDPRNAIENARKRAGRLHVGSHNRWVKEPAEGERMNTFWEAAHHANLAHTLHAYEGAILYGEAFGPVQDLKYGRMVVDFAAFDLWAPVLGRFLDFDDFMTIASFFHIPTAPVVYRGPFDMEKLLALAEEDSTVAHTPGHIREGLVIRPVRERSPHGRTIAKLISARYRLRKEA
jgi:RNA ligase (TIGR02306 family)